MPFNGVLDMMPDPDAAAGPAATAPSAGRVGLGDAINTATRGVHTKLNRLILLRLPLALPPCVPSPSLYATGLLHVTPIYATFERLWQSMLEPRTTNATTGSRQGCFTEPLDDLFAGDGQDAGASKRHLTHRTREILSSCFMPELLRSARLQDDVCAATGLSPREVEQYLDVTAQTGRLAGFLQHTRRAVEKHPHVLLAYAWVMYMALFAGGRFLRAALDSAGEEFWRARADVDCPRPKAVWRRSFPPRSAAAGEGATGGGGDKEEEDGGDDSDQDRASEESVEEDGPQRAKETPLSFFRFAAADDGEDLKKDFKRRYAAAGDSLTDKEREEIVTEASCIFENLILLVSQLDGVCGTANSQDNPLIRTNPMRLLRDSLAVAKERRIRAESGSKAGLGEDDGGTGNRTPSTISSSDVGDVVVSDEEANGSRSELAEEQGQYSDTVKLSRQPTSLSVPPKAVRFQEHHTDSDIEKPQKARTLTDLLMLTRRDTFTAHFALVTNVFLFIGLLGVLLAYWYHRQIGAAIDQARVSAS